MAFLGISQALDPWLRPSTDYAAHLLPSFMQDTRQKAELAERTRQFNEGAPLRTAQTEHEAAQALKQKNLNDLYAQIMGAQAPTTSTQFPYGIGAEEYMRSYMGVSPRKWVTTYDEKGVGRATPESSLMGGEVLHQPTERSRWQKWYLDDQAQPDIFSEANETPEALQARLQGMYPGRKIGFEVDPVVAEQRKLDLFRQQVDYRTQAQIQLAERRIALKNKYDPEKLPPKYAMRYRMLRDATRFTLEKIYASNIKLDEMAMQAEAKIAEFEAAADALYQQATNEPAQQVTPPPQVRPGATSGQAEGQPPVMYPGAQAPAPTAQPGGMVAPKTTPNDAQIETYVVQKHGKDPLPRAKLIGILINELGFTPESAEAWVNTRTRKRPIAQQTVPQGQ